MSQPNPEEFDRVCRETMQQLDSFYRPKLVGHGTDSGELSFTERLFLSPEEMTDLRTEYQSVDVEEQIGSVRFGGFEILPFAYSEQEIKDHVRLNIPPMTLRRLESIDFVRDPNPPTFTNQQEVIRHGSHIYNPLTRSSRITMLVDPLEYLASHHGEQAARAEMLRTFDHECGHAFAYALPVELLRRWHKVVTSNPVALNNYVAAHYEANSRDRYAEDLADSFSYMINQPEVLYTRSAERFFGMYDLFGYTRQGHKTAEELLEDIDEC